MTDIDLYLIALEIATRKGIMMHCADDKIQIYYLIIIRFTIGYEKQIVIIGIKFGV